MLTTVNEGDTLYSNGTSGCLSKNEPCIVQKEGSLFFVHCKKGRHYLNASIVLSAFSTSPWPVEVSEVDKLKTALLQVEEELLPAEQTGHIAASGKRILSIVRSVLGKG